MDRFIFAEQDGLVATSLYASGGTAAGTTNLNVARFGYSSDGGPIDFTQFNGREVFLGYQASGEMFHGGVGITDGTAAGTTFTVLNANGTGFIPDNIGTTNGRLLVSGTETGVAGGDVQPDSHGMSGSREDDMALF
jgi:hypothetical protein